MFELHPILLAALAGFVSALLFSSIPVGPINLTIINEGTHRGFTWALLNRHRRIGNGNDLLCDRVHRVFLVLQRRAGEDDDGGFQFCFSPVSRSEISRGQKSDGHDAVWIESGTN
ncbi:MAG: hypothetical protein WDM76_12660 [Limisphaerales bacterium]